MTVGNFTILVPISSRRGLEIRAVAVCTPDPTTSLQTLTRPQTLLHHQPTPPLHTGLGRTGVLIACYLVYALRVRANDAIRYVRMKRPNAVQTSNQIQIVQEFEAFILPQLYVFSNR